ncbi:MAG: lysophospholipid acyltransferase family protein [Deltaproteobacteria bacterium]
MKELLKDILRIAYMYPLKWIAWALPLRAAYFLAGVAGSIAYRLMSGKRTAFEAEAKRLPCRTEDAAGVVKRAFRNLMRHELEVMLFPRLNPGNIDCFVGCDGLNHLDDALKKGRGAMLLFAHFGSNQMIMPAIGHRRYAMSQLSAPATVWIEKMPNRRFSRIHKALLKMRWAHEASLPVTHINIFGSMKEAFQCLKRNEVLGIAIDGGGGKDRVTVPFLGRLARFSTGAVSIALRTGCEVLPCFMVRQGNGTHRLIIEPPIAVNAASNTEHDAVRENTMFFAKRLEEYVLKYPCHYVGFLALRTFMEASAGDSAFFAKGEINEGIARKAAIS